MPSQHTQFYMKKGKGLPSIPFPKKYPTFQVKQEASKHFGLCCFQGNTIDHVRLVSDYQTCFRTVYVTFHLLSSTLPYNKKSQPVSKLYRLCTNVEVHSIFRTLFYDYHPRQAVFQLCQKFIFIASHNILLS